MLMEGAIENYLNSYRSVYPKISDDELAFIRENVSVTHLENRTFYLKDGQVQRAMGYVYQGLLRSFYLNKKGEECTIGFVPEYGYASDYPSFIQQKPSNYFIQCLEPTTIVNLPFEAIQQAYARFKNFETYGRLIAENILIQKEERIRSFLFQSAEERYLDFLQQNEGLAQRVSLTSLSSFLGIQRQSLSRIRKNLVSK